MAIPAIVFGGAALLGGHLLLSGDNLIQNFPLRVLAGSDLARGAAPGWDPYVFGGTPLAAGLNASAYFPTTLLFAFLPSHAAWVLANVAIYGSTGVGTYCLLRSSGAAVSASFLGASTFAFAGAAATQASVHLDMANGIACLPWALLAVRKIVDDGRWRWSWLLGAALGLGVLAGSPEALLGGAAAWVTYGVLRWTVVRAPGLRTLGRALAAPAIALLVTAFVWLPGLDYIAYSQRAHVSEFAASGYSFPANAFVLAVIPYLEGGYHYLFSQLAYYGPSNSGEVTLYVGLLPVIAALLLASRRWGRWLPEGERRCWFGVLAVALVLSIAAATPVEHLLYHVPFYGHQRDSGRNIVQADLAAAALLAWWVDGGSREDWTASRREKAVALLPLAVVVAASAMFALSPATLWRSLSTTLTTSGAAHPEGVWWALALAGCLAAGAAAVVILRQRLGRPRWIRVATAFTLADIALFSLGSLYASSAAPPSAAHPGPILSAVARDLSPGGRYAVFDPGLFDQAQLASAGEPDVGILTGLPSVTGYGSLVDGVYGQVTQTPSRDYLSPRQVAAGTFSQLGLQVLVTVPESFLIPVASLPAAEPPPILPEPPGADPAIPGGTELAPNLPVVPRTSAPRPGLAAGRPQSWWFGTSLAVSSVTLELSRPAGGQVVRAGLIGPGGAVAWQAEGMLPAGDRDIAIPAAGRALGLVVQLVSGQGTGPLEAAVSSGGHHYVLAGSLSDSVEPSAWSLTATVDGFAVLRSRVAPRTAWLETAAGVAAPGTARVVSGSTTVADGATVSVDSPAGAELVVPTAYDPGWQASLSTGGVTRPVAVERHGLVMAVAVPRGTSLVFFGYHAEGYATGEAISLAGAVVLVLALGSSVLFRRRRRRRRRTLPVPS